MEHLHINPLFSLGYPLVHVPQANELVALDSSSGKQRKLSLAPEPYYFGTISGMGRVFVSSHEAPVVWVVDQKSLKLLGTIDLPAGEGHQMAVIAKDD